MCANYFCADWLSSVLVFFGALDLYDVIGLVGTFCYFLAYYLLMSRRMQSDTYGYVSLNLLAAVLVVISLVEHFNFASFMIQSGWIIISLLGICNIFKSRKKTITEDVLIEQIKPVPYPFQEKK